MGMLAADDSYKSGVYLDTRCVSKVALVLDFNIDESQDFWSLCGQTAYVRCMGMLAADDSYKSSVYLDTRCVPPHEICEKVVNRKIR
jgi:hypothetical protein